MNICIVGWYGTETLGDRSILLGLSKVMEKAFGKSKIYLGSIYPFYSRRCLYEDSNFYREISPNVDIEIFDVKDMPKFKKKIKESDLIAMGGGPIMDLQELAIMEFGFGYARKHRVKTAILGCGIGPLFNKGFRKISAHILSLSDLIILRDNLSHELAKEILDEHNYLLNTEIKVLHDPAIIPIGDFLSLSYLPKNARQLVMNLREFPAASYNKDGSDVPEQSLVELLNKLSQHFETIKLIPMHTFFIGGDDRYYLSKMQQLSQCNNIEVVNKPMSVFDLFETIGNADKCLGMRYHSVVFQTLINGNNAILDYTEPGIGKISGFLELINGSQHYKDKYINIQRDELDVDALVENILSSSTFKVDNDIFPVTENKFVRCLKELMNYEN